MRLTASCMRAGSPRRAASRSLAGLAQILKGLLVAFAGVFAGAHRWWWSGRSCLRLSSEVGVRSGLLKQPGRSHERVANQRNHQGQAFFRVVGNSKVRHHQLPRFYLSSWAPQGRLEAIRKDSGKVVQQAVSNASVERSFYGASEFGTLDQPDFMENDLSAFETQVAPAVKRAAFEPGWPMSAEDRSLCADFAALLLVRSPAIRKQIKARGSLMRFDGPAPGPDEVSVQQALRMVSGEPSGSALLNATPAYTHITEMGHMYVVWRPLFSRAMWLRLDFEQNCLITSDSPVSLLRNFRYTRWFDNRPISSALLLPLSPSRGLVIHPTSGSALFPDVTQLGTPDEAQIFNSHTMENATQWGYKHPYSDVVVGLPNGSREDVTVTAPAEDVMSWALNWLSNTGNLPRGPMPPAVRDEDP